MTPKGLIKVSNYTNNVQVYTGCSTVHITEDSVTPDSCTHISQSTDTSYNTQASLSGLPAKYSLMSLMLNFDSLPLLFQLSKLGSYD